MPCAYTHRIPPELHLLVQDNLDRPALAALARTSKALRALCVPALFRTVSLPSLDALLAFLAHVPPAYRTHIRALDLCTRAHGAPSDSDALTPRTDALAALLASTPRLERLALRLERGLAPHILPSFAALPRLAHLDIASLDDEADVPLSERLVVAIAKSLPALTHLSLTRITRSLAAAPDLLCPPSPLLPFALPAYPSLPLVANDLPLSPTDADADDLALPALLALPLHHLAILDTHLGHPAWAAAPGIPGPSAPSAAHGAPAPASSFSTAAQRTLTSLDIGAHPDLPPAHNQALAAALLFRRGGPASPSASASPWPALRTLRLHAGLPSPPDSLPSPLGSLSPSPSSFDVNSAHPHPRLPALTALRLSALVPPSALAPTLRALGAARAPLRALEACVLREDVGEACVALGEWVRARVGALGGGADGGGRGERRDGDEDEVGDGCEDGGVDEADEAAAARWLPRLRTVRVRVVAAVEGDVEVANTDAGADGDADAEMDAEATEAVRALLACCADAGIEVRVEGVGAGVGAGVSAGGGDVQAKEAGEAGEATRESGGKSGGGEKGCGP